MSTPAPLPPGHDWTNASEYDKALYRCRECDVEVPVTAADIQAGIRLYCPECSNQMDEVQRR